MKLRKLAVLLSGRGSNFEAIAEAIRSGALPAEIVLVLSNRPDAPGLAKARALGLDARLLDHREFPSREDHEREVLRLLDASGAEIVVLAGYMRMLSPTLIEPWRNRIVNIHPSLLPAFPGMHAQAQAIDYGVKVSGCTVHFVDENLDAGPIILQRCVQVREDDDEESLAARILVEEHAVYVEALRRLCGPYRVEGRRVVFG